MSSEEGVEDGDGVLPKGFLERCEQQWQRTVEHYRNYPYVWASYIVTFGGLGLVGAWRWRELRRMENQVMELQRELLKRVQQEEAAAAEALKQHHVAEALKQPRAAEALKQPHAAEAPVVAKSTDEQAFSKS